MKLIDLRKRAKEELCSLGIEEADADFVIAETLNCRTTELPLINEISREQAAAIETNLNKRKAKMPVDKIFGRAYFYGLEFKIDNGVLAPRQDSEILVETALKYIKQGGIKTALDLCTGSGCLAISIAKNAKLDMTAADISAHALGLAKQNAKTNGVAVKFIKSDMFSSLTGKFDLIVCNPPYIESETIKNLDDEVKLFDPLLALDGGADGLDFYRTICAQAKRFLRSGGLLILEIGYNQKRVVKSLFSGYKFLEGVVDLGGNDRVLVFKNKERL